MKRMVRRPCWARRSSARRSASRSSLTPESTALSDSKCALVRWRTTWASVVLPDPGGPQRMIEGRRSASRRAAAAGPPRGPLPGPRARPGSGAGCGRRGARPCAAGRGTRIARGAAGGGEQEPRTVLAAARHRRKRTANSRIHPQIGCPCSLCRPRPRPGRGCRRRSAFTRCRRRRAHDGLRPLRVRARGPGRAPVGGRGVGVRRRRPARSRGSPSPITASGRPSWARRATRRPPTRSSPAATCSPWPAGMDAGQRPRAWRSATCATRCRPSPTRRALTADRFLEMQLEKRLAELQKWSRRRPRPGSPRP